MMNLDKQTEAWIDQTIATLSVERRGDTIVSPCCLIESAAGFFIGKICLEWDEDQWVVVPFTKCTDYMWSDEGYHYLNAWELEDPGSTIQPLT